MKINEYLSEEECVAPLWLLNYKQGDKIDIKQVLSSRIVYYPGSRYDGQPIKTFNVAQAGQTYVYVDYGVTEEETIKELKEEGCFNGYHLLDIQSFSEKELVPHGWTQHCVIPLDQLKVMPRAGIDYETQEYHKPFGLVAIYERNEDQPASHGLTRFAVVFICGDGVATYDALFVNGNCRVPYVLVLQDHGFGGNYTSFGKGGLLDKIVNGDLHYLPRYILCAENTYVWDNYIKLDLEPAMAMGRVFRYLYKLDWDYYFEDKM